MTERPAHMSLAMAIGLSFATIALAPYSPSQVQAQTQEQTQEQTQADYSQLVSLYTQWRNFDVPPMLDGAHDYSPATTKARHDALKKLQARLAAIDVTGWSLDRQVDYHIVRAEMNGLDFHIRVLRPWERDPAFYQQILTYRTDVPVQEGTTNHALIDLWAYEFPLNDTAAAKLGQELRSIPPLLRQARQNLTGNAADLWRAGIKTIDNQADALDALGAKLVRKDLKAAQAAALKATRDLATWLKAELPKKNGPSGIGKENYTWLLQNVYLAPYSWEDEVMLLKRELKRAHASLRLEEHRNRALPPLKAPDTAAAYDRLTQDRLKKLMTFLETNDIIDIKPYMEPAIKAQIGAFLPPEQRNFFNIASHLEPMPLFTHYYHWWDLALMETEPHASPIRRNPLLYNIWMGRAEGMSTAMEEMMMHAGLYDDNPRAREIVWIMLAQRAARGLASLYAQSNDFTMKEASDFHVEWTPRGWMSPSLDLLGIEQQLYLRQPGYGTSYISGKDQVESLLADRAHQEGEAYSIKRFFREFDAEGMIPISLIRWKLTGDDSEIRAITSP